MRIGHLLCAALSLVLLIAPMSPAFAGAHTWDVNELFSNADGSIQFIELREAGGGNLEAGVGGHTVTSNTKTFTIPSNVASPTGFKTILFATASFAALPGAPAPDHIISAGFFALNGDTVRYNPYDLLTFGAGALPTNGILSLNRNLSTGVNSPRNYAGVTGTVDASPAPPGVPDGSAGSIPMTVEALDAAGTSLSISWDTSTCTANSVHQILYGQGSDLPASAGGTMGLAGGACGLGATSPFVWSPAPSAIDGTGLIWWVLVVNNGAGKEGSWGTDSAGVERVGPALDGSSGQCGVTNRNLANICGH